MKTESEQTCHHCNVPIELHGTCCGWINAKVPINQFGVIIDNRHPNFGQQLGAGNAICEPIYYPWIKGYSYLNPTP